LNQEKLADTNSATIEQLSAVRVVLGNARLTTEYDILISTAIEILRSGPKTQDQIATHIAQTWPEAPANLSQIRSALAAAETADYVVRTTDGWALSMQGLAEAAEARRWAEGVYERAFEELRSRAAAWLRPVEISEAQLWLGILVKALFDGIKWAYSALKGEVDLVRDTAIVPRRVDKDRLFMAIRSMAKRDEVAEFLEACALDAIDPSAPFGTEIVSHITTGYLLHAFMARRDLLTARNQIPSLSGTTLILDTPLLFPLLDLAAASEPITRAIEISKSVGAAVVVSEHSLNELQSVLDRVIARHAQNLDVALRTPINGAVLRRLVDEPFVELYVAGLQDGRWRDWSGFRRHVGKLRRTLRGLGVVVRPHGNRPEDRVAECFGALSKSLEGSQHGRGIAEIERDANTVALAWKIRRDRRSGGIWPSSWVITPDTHMNRAYRVLNRKDSTGIAIAPSQWVAALSAVVPAGSLDQLAASGAAFLTQETFVRVAARFPPEVAMTLAAALGNDPVTSELDARVGQLTLDQLLSQYPDLLADPEAAGATIAASIVAHRSDRVAKAQAHEEKRLANMRVELNEREARTQSVLATERERRAQAEQRIKTLEGQVASHEQAATTSKVLAPRRRVANTVLVAGLVLAALLGATGAVEATAGKPYMPWVILAAGTALTLGLFWARSRQWCTDTATHWTVLLAAFLPEVVAIALTLLPYIAPVVMPSGTFPRGSP
jgi:hypothetical protein